MTDPPADWLRTRIEGEFVVERDGWAGERVDRVTAALQRDDQAVTAHREALGIDAPADHTAVLRVVRATSGREGCATLAWQALSSALTGVAQIPVAGGEIHGDGTPADAA